jgi:rhamnosyltransferase
MKRILFFVHYNKYNGLAEYILYLLEKIKHNYDRIILISNSPISDDNLIKLKDLCNDIIIRENKGFDFGAWKDALLKEGWEKLSQFDNVTIMNDSCFGPLFDLQEIYTNMEQDNIDFWGLTLYKNTKKEMSDNNASIPEHIQNYFMCFNKNVVSSSVFQNFWVNVDCLNNVKYYYKTQITLLLSKYGFKYSVKYSPNHISFNIHNDIAAWHPDYLINNNIPFIKIESIINFPYQKYIIDLIKNNSNYPLELIFNHVTEVFNPNLSLKVCNKLIPAIPLNDNISSKSIAIHLHTYYLDVFEIFLNFFNNISIDFDLFITTDTIDKENKIKAYIKNTNTQKRLKNIIVTENRGRDILPWLNISDILNKYDVVGHFHTKKTLFEDEWKGKTWMHDIFELLLVPINIIIDEFNKNSNLGIIIPEIPVCYHIKPSLLEKNDQFFLNSSLNEMWKKSNCFKELDFFTLKTIIMSYGNMFWYRPASLQSLFQMNLTSDDFGAEPIKNNLTTIHFIERLLVYFAWNNGFDYRIMFFNHPKISTFIDHEIFSDTFSSIKCSKPYRIGQLLLFIPKMFINFFKIIFLMNK